MLAIVHNNSNHTVLQIHHIKPHRPHVQQHKRNVQHRREKQHASPPEHRRHEHVHHSLHRARLLRAPASGELVPAVPEPRRRRRRRRGGSPRRRAEPTVAVHLKKKARVSEFEN